MCAIGRGLMAAPKLLLIDELSLGLAPRAVELLTESAADQPQSGVAILLVEQDVTVALSCRRAAISWTRAGSIVAAPTAELAEHPKVRSSYFGGVAKKMDLCIQFCRLVWQGHTGDPSNRKVPFRC